MSAHQTDKKAGSSFANAGVRFLKKLVLENYEDQAQDRRAAERHRVVGEAHVSVTGPKGQALGETRVFIRDSSGTGCGLWSRVEMPVGSVVMVTTAGADGRAGVQRLGRVRHCRGALGSGFAVGVQFDRESASFGEVG
jgi:hypothetical protein